MHLKKKTRVRALGPLAVIAIAAGGCQAFSLSERGEVIAPSDFARPSPGTVGESQPDVITPAADAPTHDEAVPESVEGEGGDVVIRSPNEPNATRAPILPPPSKPLAPGDELVVDSMVGQINGRPVYANLFLEPLEAEIRANASAKSPLAFSQWLQDRIALRMREILEEELILARANQMLTPEQQLGLFRWLDQQKGQLVRQKGGSTDVAREQWEATEGISLDEALDERKKIALIRMVLEREVKPRVIVSWKDVERKYRSEYLRGAGNGELRLGWIHLDPSNTEMIGKVQARLDEGEAFGDVAEFAGIPNKGNFGVTGVLPIPPGGLENLQSESLYEEYLEVIRSLGVGETSAGSVITLNRTGAKRYIWWHVYSVTYPQPPSLFDPDIQLRLQQEIFNEEFDKERRRYMDSLMTPVIQAEINKMVDRLSEIARKRYS